MSALAELNIKQSTSSLDPSLLKSIVNEVAWKLFDASQNVSINVKVFKVIPISFKLGDFRDLWTSLFGPEVASTT